MQLPAREETAPTSLHSSPSLVASTVFSTWLASQMLSLSEIPTRTCQKFDLSNDKVATQGLVPTKAVAEN